MNWSVSNCQLHKTVCKSQVNSEGILRIPHSATTCPALQAPSRATVSTIQGDLHGIFVM